MPIGVYKRTIGKRHHTKETKLKMSEKAKLLVGSKHSRWKGGLHNYCHKIARAIYYEHNVDPICEICHSPKRIYIHHIDWNYKNNILSNLQGLCASCHLKIHKPNSNIRKMNKFKR